MTKPDFTYEAHDEHDTTYPALGQPGHFWRTPYGLALVQRPDGLADLHLSLVRATLPQPRTYGTLELSVQAEYASVAAVAQVAGSPTPITWRPLLPASGYLRLSLGETVLIQPLAWNGLSQTRVRLSLSAGEASVMRQALEQGVLVAQATAVLVLEGYAARSAATVTFDPRALVAALGAARDETGLYAYPALQSLLARAWARLPLRWQSGQADPRLPTDAIQQAALLDRLVARYATLASPPTANPLPYLALPDAVPSGVVTWRLDDELLTWRPLVLQWRPLDVVQEQIAKQGLAPFFTQIDVPPLPSGVLEIAVVGNLPANRPNVLSIGAHLAAPPRPPMRPHPVQATATLTPPHDSSTVRLRLGPKEAPSYTVQPFVVVVTATDFLSLEGNAWTGQGATVELSVADYPVTFYGITGEPALLALARLTGELQWQAGEQQHRVPVTLDEQQPEVTIAVPQSAVAPTLHLQATALTDGQTLPVLPLPVADGYVTRWHLPGFGAHTIRFIARQAPAEPFTIEVQTEDAAEAITTSSRLLVRSDQPTAQWGYVVLNPFRAGFRYRRLPADDWSPFLSPLEQTEITL